MRSIAAMRPCAMGRACDRDVLGPCGAVTLPATTVSLVLVENEAKTAGNPASVHKRGRFRKLIRNPIQSTRHRSGRPLSDQRQQAGAEAEIGRLAQWLEDGVPQRRCRSYQCHQV
jgi:hypothetical protein